MNLFKILPRRTTFKTVRPTSSTKTPSTNIEPLKLVYTSFESKDPSQNLYPLIINHGIFGSRLNFIKLSQYYNETTKRQVLTVDARNHGESPHSNQHTYDLMVEDMKHLLVQLKFKKAAFLGHSMGGRTIMSFALKYPQLVDRLVVVDVLPISPASGMKSIAAMFSVLQRLKIPKNAAEEEKPTNGELPKSAAEVEKPSDVEFSKFLRQKKIRRYIMANLRRTPDGSYGWKVNIPVILANLEKLEQFPPVECCSFQGPVLFVRGDNNNSVTKDELEKILVLFPKAEFKDLQKAGHWLHSEKPTEFLECTAEFLNRLVT